MKPPPPSRGLAGFFVVLLVAGLAMVVGLVLHRPVSQGKPQLLVQAQRNVTYSVPKSVATTAMGTPEAKPAVPANKPDFKERPFPVAYESPDVQWTLADGKDTNVIRQLAHNSLEYDRMVQENSRIFRRQLVYLKQTAAAVFEDAKLTGKAVQQLTLPGVDGQELQFEIVKSDGNGSSRQGMFSGHLAGNLDSTVSFAFLDGRESYTVLDPKENIYVVGEPREDGQVIVKAIDPNTYGVGPPEEGDDFVKTDSSQK